MKLQTNDAGTAATLQQDLLRLYFSDACRLLDSLQAGRLSDAALTHAGLTREDIVRGTPALQFDAFFRLLDWLHDARPVPLAPLRLGLMRRLEDHGLYGRAVVSVRTFGESLRMVERFFGVSWQGVRLSVHQEGDTVVNRYVMMPSAVCRPQPLLQMLIGTSVAVTRELLPDADLSSCLAQYPFRAGQDDRGQTALLGCRTAFGSGHGSYRFPSAWLSRPITMAPALGTSQVAAVALWRARWRTGSAWAGRCSSMGLRDSQRWTRWLQRWDARHALCGVTSPKRERHFNPCWTACAWRWPKAIWRTLA